MRVVLTDCPPCSPGVDIPGSVDSNPLDKAQLPPISGPPSPPAQMNNGRPKTSNPNFRDPRKLPKLISSSGSATETKYRQETLPEEEEETTAPAGGEQEENEEEADADDEAELTDVREDKEGSEIKPQETTEEEVQQDLASTLGILLTVKLRRKVVELINSIEMSEPVTAPTESVEPQSETKEEAEETESAESNSNQPEEKQEDKAEAAADNEKNERAVEEKKEELNLPSSGPQGETTQLLTDIKTDLTHYKIFQVV